MTGVGERYLRLPEVRHRTGLSRSTIYLFQADGRFPQSVRIGRAAVGWRESDVERWIAAPTAWEVIG